MQAIADETRAHRSSDTQGQVAALSRLVGCFLALALLASSCSARAQCSVTAHVGSTATQDSSGPITASGGSDFGSFSAVATYGTLSAWASLPLIETSSDDGLTTIAEFQDEILITAPGVPMYTQGILTAVVETAFGPEVEQTATGSGVSQGMNTGYQFILSRNGGGLYFPDGSILYNSGQEPPEFVLGSVPAPGVVAIDIPFSFGLPFDLSGFLTVRAGGHNTLPPGTSGTIWGYTAALFLWNGITSIRDAGQNEYLGIASVTSCSGTNWLNSQPTGVSLYTPTRSVLELEPNAPNPFNPRTTLRFRLAKERHVRVRIYDSAGRPVATLINGRLDAGTHALEWNARDSSGRDVASGVYHYRVMAGSDVASGKMVLLK